MKAVNLALTTHQYYLTVYQKQKSETYICVAYYCLGGFGLKDRYLTNWPKRLESWKTIFEIREKNILLDCMILSWQCQILSPWRYLGVLLQVSRGWKRWRWQQASKQTWRWGGETGIRKWKWIPKPKPKGKSGDEVGKLEKEVKVDTKIKRKDKSDAVQAKVKALAMPPNKHTNIGMR